MSAIECFYNPNGDETILRDKRRVNEEDLTDDEASTLEWMKMEWDIEHSDFDTGLPSIRNTAHFMFTI